MDMRTDIFNLMKSYGFTMKMYDSDGNGPIISAAKADYIFSERGTETYMFVLEDDTSKTYKHLAIYKSNTENSEEFRKLLKSIKTIVLKNAYTMTLKNFGRRISPKDFSFLPKMNREKDKNPLLDESFSISGTKKTSYHKTPAAKVVVRHKNEVNEKSINPRSRNIKEMFVATKNGERRKIESGQLSVGKAVANYVNGGGSLYDSTTNQIIHLGNDLKTLKSIGTNESYTVIEGSARASIDSLVQEARKQINKFISGIGRRKRHISENYLDFLESPEYDFSRAYYEGIIEDKALAEALARASMFVEKDKEQDYLNELDTLFGKDEMNKVYAKDLVHKKKDTVKKVLTELKDQLYTKKLNNSQEFVREMIEMRKNV
jgi:hypothetical protein